MIFSDSAARERNEIKGHWEQHPYYDVAEQYIYEFWAERCRFRRMFDTLDLTSVVELACGHGRHTAQFIDRAGYVVLSDINQSNIDYCKARFIDRGNVGYHVSSGADLSGIADQSATALFCYDAMVHFELADIWSYLNDFARVLEPGGRALIHYSNYTGNPGGKYRENPHSRSFCGEGVFRHIAIRAGLEIVESETFGWGAQNWVAATDALTLLRRP